MEEGEGKHRVAAFDYEEVIDNPIICYSLEQACRTLKVFCEYETVNVNKIHFKIMTRNEDLLEQVFIVADREYRSDPNPIYLDKWFILTRCTKSLHLFSVHSNQH